MFTRGNRTRRSAQFGLLCILMVAGVFLASQLASGSSDPPRQLGIILPWSSQSQFLRDLDQKATQIGAQPKIVSIFRDWTIPLMNLDIFNGIIARGAVPEVSWESWDPGGRSTAIQPAYSLTTIINGNHDAYIRTSAQEAAAWGRPLMVRFGPEMNGDWAPWGATNGNTPAEFVQAWQHVVQIFRDEGANNVMWVWTPNETPADTIASYYPGDSWVDVVGVDAYNWGATASTLSVERTKRFNPNPPTPVATSNTWRTFTQVFQTSYSIITHLTATKPFEVSETASSPTGGDKAAWITSAFLTEIPRLFPRITSVIWFDIDKEQDWRIDSSQASLAAYRQVAADPGWGGSSPPTTTGTTTTVPTTTTMPTTTTAPALEAPVLTGRLIARRTVLNWDAVPDATGYVVQRSTSPTFLPPSYTTTQNTNITYIFHDTHWFRVRAVDSSETSDWSNVVSVG